MFSLDYIFYADFLHLRTFWVIGLWRKGGQIGPRPWGLGLKSEFFGQWLTGLTCLSEKIGKCRNCSEHVHFCQRVSENYRTLLAGLLGPKGPFPFGFQYYSVNFTWARATAEYSWWTKLYWTSQKKSCMSWFLKSSQMLRLPWQMVPACKLFCW
jgi:hypothetical protein